MAARGCISKHQPRDRVAYLLVSPSRTSRGEGHSKTDLTSYLVEVATSGQATGRIRAGEGTDVLPRVSPRCSYLVAPRADISNHNYGLVMPCVFTLQEARSPSPVLCPFWNAKPLNRARLQCPPDWYGKACTYAFMECRV